jgi:nicotinamide riboside kinase
MGFFTGLMLEELERGSWQEQEERASVRAAMDQLRALHKFIRTHLRTQSLDLHLMVPDSNAVQFSTVCDRDTEEVLTVAYTRARGQAVTVERLMGREEIASVNTVDIRRHPALEMRLSRDAFAIELLLSPAAWWDQQNLAGKLTVERHRMDFYEMLQQCDNYIMGFWQGTHLSDLRLESKYFQHTRIMDEWLSTFQPAADWFRLGVWYELDAPELSEENIEDEILKQLRVLHALYQHLLWTSDNNFRDFYER